MTIPLLGAYVNQFEIFLLVFVRMTGLFVIAPIFGRQNVPTYLKIGFSFFLALMLVSSVKIDSPIVYSDIYNYALLVIKEFIVGLSIGYVAYMVFSAIYMAGQLIDMQVGFGMVSVLDPLSNIQVPVTSNFYYMMTMLVFMAVNGHHVLIRSLYESYSRIPLGGAVFNTNMLNGMIKIFGDMLVIGFKVSAPIIAAILLVDIALGVISRTMPQLNIFVVGMPLKIVVGILVMIFIIPAFVNLIGELVKVMDSETHKFINHMGGK